MILPIALAGLVLAFWCWQFRRCEQEYRALCAECDCAEAFYEWRMRNQGVYIGLSPEGRMLVVRWLNAYEWFLRTHTFIDGAEHRDWIASLLNDLPPKHPDSVPGKKRRPNEGTPIIFCAEYFARRLSCRSCCH